MSEWLFKGKAGRTKLARGKLQKIGQEIRYEITKVDMLKTPNHSIKTGRCNLPRIFGFQ